MALLRVVLLAVVVFATRVQRGGVSVKELRGWQWRCDACRLMSARLFDTADDAQVAFDQHCAESSHRWRTEGVNFDGSMGK
jgi:hypothetical protein